MSKGIMEDSVSIERRDVLKGAGVGVIAAGALAATTVAGVSQVFAADHGHHHAMHSSTDKEMVDTLHACIKAGNECVAHCFELIKAGDTSIAGCMKSVQETIAFCTAHATHAAYNSKYLDDLCRLSLKICEDCQAECERHAKKHVQCKTCAESCAACIRVCKKHLKV